MKKNPKVIHHIVSSLLNNHFLVNGSLITTNNATRNFNPAKVLKLSVMACIVSTVCSCASSSAQAQLRTYESSASYQTTPKRNSSTYHRSHTYAGNNSYSRSYGNGFQKTSDDKIRTLIQNKSNDYEHTAHDDHHGHSHSNDEWEFSNGNMNSTRYYDWIQSDYNQQRVSQYEQFLARYLGKNNIPPMSQLLLTARTWQKCGEPIYEVPPSNLWNNMIPTLQLYTSLKNQEVIPQHTVIRSVYRNPSLNKCAGGANGSKHKMNAAMDLWLPEFEYDEGYKEKIREQLCQFWLYNGESHNMGLGIYKTGAIHIDTQGYRKWGGKYTASYSSCRD